MKDGGSLEELVAHIEQTLLGQGFEVTTNKRAYDSDGGTTAEFDVEVRGKVGSTKFAWLIECRDRPSQGPAPAAWIEQLVGRRDRFGFDKVSAVSATGFSKHAVDFAMARGIELREVREIDPSELSLWPSMDCVRNHYRHSELKQVVAYCSPELKENEREALSAALANLNQKPEVLRGPGIDDRITFNEAFVRLIDVSKDKLEMLVPNGEPRWLNLTARFEQDAIGTIDTAVGPVRVAELHFSGTVRLIEKLSPVIRSLVYAHSDTGEKISETAIFAPFDHQGIRTAIEIHKVHGKEGAQFVIRAEPLGVIYTDTKAP